jgi:hypothetical protein
VVEIDETVVAKLEGAPKHAYCGLGQQWGNTVMALVRFARSTCAPESLKASSASASPIDGLTSEVRSKRMKRQAERFLAWRNHRKNRHE